MNGHLNESKVQCPKPLGLTARRQGRQYEPPKVKRIMVFPLGALDVLAVKFGALWTSPFGGYTFAHGEKVEFEHR